MTTMRPKPDLPRVTLLADNGSDRAPSYSMSNKVVRHRDGVFVTWLDDRLRVILAQVDPDTGTVVAASHGAVCMMHSCGAIRDLIPILIEDVGLDILQACQPEANGMEPAALKRDFGDRITYSGMLGLQKTLTQGTAEECRREAERLVTVIGKDGGYIFEPANSVTKDVPLENILAAYEVATGKSLL